MSRLFTFGCSFTNFSWPTWADILARNFKTYENWGQCGAGNQFIYNALVECHLKNNINQKDTVAIMWTSAGREDRYVDRKWITPGNIWNSNLYDKSFLEKFVDPRGFIIRDLALMYGAKTMLDHIGCRYYLFSMVPITQSNDYQADLIPEDIDDVIPYFNSMLDRFLPSIYEVVFDFDWDSRPFSVIGQESFWKGWYNRIKDQSWPDLTDKKSYNTLPQVIQKECEEVFGFFIPNPNNPNSRADYHPTPSEYLEYLDRVLEDNHITQETRDWVEDCDKQVRDGTWKQDTKKPIARW